MISWYRGIYNWFVSNFPARPHTSWRLGHQLFSMVILLLLIQEGLWSVKYKLKYIYIAPDKAAYCIFTQFRGRENAIKFISVRTKTQ